MNDKYAHNKSNNQYHKYLTEEDFYTASDKRFWVSYVEDIDGGDNFADFCRDFFELLDEEGYYDWFLFVTDKVIILGGNYQVEITA